MPASAMEGSPHHPPLLLEPAGTNRIYLRNILPHYFLLQHTCTFLMDVRARQHRESLCFCSIFIFMSAFYKYSAVCLLERQRNDEEAMGPALGKAAANRLVPGDSSECPEHLQVGLPLPAPPSTPWHHSVTKNTTTTTTFLKSKLFSNSLLPM